MSKKTNVTIMCQNDELSSTMSWVGCLLKVSELFILFAEHSQILLKISIIPFLLTFMCLITLNLLVNNQLNSSLGHIIVTMTFLLLRIALQDFQTFLRLFDSCTFSVMQWFSKMKKHCVGKIVIYIHNLTVESQEYRNIENCGIW